MRSQPLLLELIKQIKAKSPHTKIVVVSAQRNIELIAELQAEGIFNYLVKSEACLTYLHHVIEDLLIVIKHRSNT
jgi:DNA-binding NarL/FixJ family response regulator